MKDKTTTIVAICGKSASGKDTLAKKLVETTSDSHLIVSDTTRPKRVNEVDGVDYHFITKNQFLSKRYYHDYLEWTEFRNWYYGTAEDEIKPDKINIGVFNLEGMSWLLAWYNLYNIQPILLKVPWYKRLYRSIKRENAFHWEYVRRLWTDFWDYKEYKRILKAFPNLLVCKDTANLVIF